jgi:lipopolysaccharide transport system ATP-binding protein
MSKEILSVNDVSKSYRLGKINSGSFKSDLSDWSKSLFSKKELVDISKYDRPDHYTAVKDVSFTINEGDSLAIMGGNGAGKSTLLKLISRVTTPDKGSIFYKGRLTSLLEVGTGFHPELSGRENIYLNGAILGMKRNEIKRKIDSIVEFSGVQKFLDTAVKRYSSGMYVRLAFSVSAFLDTDILILDEVLAVGDAEFQRKCVERITSMIKREGKTVLFVGHNQNAASTFCNKGLLLEKGELKYFGDYWSAFDLYNMRNLTNRDLSIDCEIGSIRLQRFYIDDAFTEGLSNVDKVVVGVDFCVNDTIEEYVVNIDISVAQGILATRLTYNLFCQTSGEHTIYFHIPSSLFVGSQYLFNLSVLNDVGRLLYSSNNPIYFNRPSLDIRKNEKGIFNVENYTAELLLK